MQSWGLSGRAQRWGRHPGCYGGRWEPGWKVGTARAPRGAHGGAGLVCEPQDGGGVGNERLRFDPGDTRVGPG